MAAETLAEPPPRLPPAPPEPPAAAAGLFMFPPPPPRVCAWDMAGNNSRIPRQSSFFITSPSREPDAGWLRLSDAACRPPVTTIDKLRPDISVRDKFLKLNSVGIGQSARQRIGRVKIPREQRNLLNIALLMSYVGLRVCKTLANSGTLRRGKTCVVERQVHAPRMERAGTARVPFRE